MNEANGIAQGNTANVEKAIAALKEEIRFREASNRPFFGNISLRLFYEGGRVNRHSVSHEDSVTVPKEQPRYK